ncbi:unnamed protein product, partial [Bubo scandiacus]
MANTNIRGNGWHTGISVVISPANKQAASPVQKLLLLLLGWPFLGHREQHLPAASTAVLLVGLKTIPF